MRCWRTLAAARVLAAVGVVSAFVVAPAIAEAASGRIKAIYSEQGETFIVLEEATACGTGRFVIQASNPNKAALKAKLGSDTVPPRRLSIEWNGCTAGS